MKFSGGAGLSRRNNRLDNSGGDIVLLSLVK